MSHITKKIGTLYKKKADLETRIADLECNIDRKIKNIGGMISYVAKQLPPDAEVYLLKPNTYQPFKGYEEFPEFKNLPIFKDAPNMEITESLAITGGELVSLFGAKLAKSDIEVENVNPTEKLRQLKEKDIEEVGNRLDEIVKEYNINLPKKYQPRPKRS